MIIMKREAEGEKEDENAKTGERNGSKKKRKQEKCT